VSESAIEQRVHELAVELPSVIKMMVRREVRNLAGTIHPGEQLLAIAQGRYEGKQGLLAVTDRRLIFLEQGMIRRKQQDFPYDRVSSIGSKRGLAFGTLTIHAAGSQATIDQVSPKEFADRAAELVRARLGAPARQTTALSEDPLDQIKKLSELRDAGILTEEEFERKKAQLLGLD